MHGAAYFSVLADALARTGDGDLVLFMGWRGDLACVRHAVDTYGALHYAVNNAGIGGAQAPTGEVDLDDWQRVIDINLNGVLYGMRYQIAEMLKAGAAESAIVNMTSIRGAWPRSATVPTPPRSTAWSV